MTDLVREADSITVREATAEDIVAVVPVFDAYRAFYGAPSDLAATRAFLEARHLRGDAILIAALHQDAEIAAASVVGFTQLYPCFSSVSLRRVYILNDLFVLPAWRRTRVGRRLVLFAAGRAAAHGAIRLELATQHTNSPARRLYDALGFRPDLDFTHLSLALPCHAPEGTGSPQAELCLLHAGTDAVPHPGRTASALLATESPDASRR